MKLSKILASSITATLLSSALLAGGNATHWGYTGHEGPSNWGDLDPNYTMCKAGSSQSPINITNKVSSTARDLENISFKYVAGASGIVNNGHTIQVNIDNGCDIEIDGIYFTLKQFHFHTPSENQIEGKNFPLEAHFVHVSKDGAFAVIAVMFEDGAENPFIKKIWSHMPHEAGKTNPVTISAKEIKAFLPKKKDYYRFEGSLTTPPCSEGVRWLVLKNFSTISESQVKEFLDVVHHENNRPIQPINARKVIN